MGITGLLWALCGWWRPAQKIPEILRGFAWWESFNYGICNDFFFLYLSAQFFAVIVVRAALKNGEWGAGGNSKPSPRRLNPSGIASAGVLGGECGIHGMGQRLDD